MANLPGIDTVWDDFLRNTERREVTPVSNLGDDEHLHDRLPPDFIGEGGWRTRVIRGSGVTIDRSPLTEDEEREAIIDEADSAGREFRGEFSGYYDAIRRSRDARRRSRELNEPMRLGGVNVETDYLDVMGIPHAGTPPAPLDTDRPPPGEVDPIELDIQNMLGSVGIRYAPPRNTADARPDRRTATAAPEGQQGIDIGAEAAARPEEALGQHNLIQRLLGLLVPHAPSLERGAREFQEAFERGETPRLTFSSEEIDEAASIFSSPATMTGARGARRLASHVASHGNSDEVRAALRSVSSIHDYARTAERIGTSDAEIIAEANRRLAATSARLPGGGSVQDIFGGLSRGVDGQWRVELSDLSGRLTGRGSGIFEAAYSPGLTAEAHSLSEFLHHPALFAMYPELANVRVIFNRQRPSRLTTESARYGMGPDGRHVIEVSARDGINARSSLYHEIQHVIQDIEGFAGGSTVNRYFSINQSKNTRRATEQLDQFARNSAIGLLSRGDIDGARRLIDQLPPWIKPHAERIIVDELANHSRNVTGIVRFTGRTLDEVSEYLVNNPNISRPLSLLAIADRVDSSIYRAVAGEVEARATQARLELSAEERRTRPPSADMRHPDRQIVVPRDDTGPTRVDMAVASPNPSHLPREVDSIDLNPRINPRFPINYRLRDLITPDTPIPRVNNLLGSRPGRSAEITEEMMPRVHAIIREGAMTLAQNHSTATIRNRLRRELQIVLNPGEINGYIRELIREEVWRAREAANATGGGF